MVFVTWLKISANWGGSLDTFLRQTETNSSLILLWLESWQKTIYFDTYVNDVRLAWDLTKVIA